MSDATPAPEPSEREHQEAIASLRALERAATADWQDVALGRRDLGEVASDRAEAGDDPETIERAKALFRPYDDLEQRRLLDALLAETAKPRVVEPAANDAGRGRRTAGILSLVAIAAAVAIVLFVLAGPRGGDGSPQVAALPDYAIQTDGGLAKTRGEPKPEAAPLRYAPNNEFEWIVRPQRDVHGPPPAFAVIARDAYWQPTTLSPTTEIAESGAIKLTGTIFELGLAPGEWTIELTLLRWIGWHVDAVVFTIPLTLEPSA